MPQSSRYLDVLELQQELGLDDPRKNCYVCAQMMLRKPNWKQSGLSTTCLLCNNPFCELHKGKEDGVCEIKHQTYCSKPEHKLRHAPVPIYVSLEERRKALGEESPGSKRETEG